MFAESGGQPAGALPLGGLTVVALCENVAGPYAGQILSQLGAEVTKIERHGVGDSTRQWGPPDFRDEGVVFHVMNAGKRSVSLDLRAPQDHSLGLSFRIDGLRPRPTAPAPSLDAHGTSFRSERETAS
jgi:crotonobetainyl-CoA:carnitine CoA-transferase CaiB-like acyl-CoA transferase